MRLVRWPLPLDTPAYPLWSGPAVLLGDHRLAQALKQQIETSGGQAHVISAEGTLEQAIFELERIWQAGPASHLFLLGASEAEPMDPLDGDSWARRRSQGIELPFFFCQRWVQLAREANLLERASIVATTALGGDFGFAESVPSPEGGWVTGLIKSLFIELVRMNKLDNLLVKAVDAPSDEPPELLAASICRELAGRTDDFEIAFRGGRRYLQNAVPCDVEALQTTDIRPGAAWVVTGGARGITAATALELGRRYGLDLHLIGASPEPQIDPAWLDYGEAELAALKTQIMREAYERGEAPPAAWRNVEKGLEIARSLREFAAAGVSARYYRCDVADRAALARVLDAIRASAGPIEGILHGAGIDIAKRFEKKERSGVMATFGAKVEGAANLMALTAHDPVRHFLGYGSVSGRLGSNGQTDYAAASDMLAKLLAWYAERRPECRVTAFHWAPWADVGMAMRPENRVALKVKDAPLLLPKDEGIAHLVRELYDRAAPRETLIIDPRYYRLFYNKGEPPAVADDEAPDVALPALPAPSSCEAQAADEAAASHQLTERFVLRMLDAPLPLDKTGLRPIVGPVYVLGDNRIVQAIERTCAAQQIQVMPLRMQPTIEATLAALDAAWSRQPGNHLVLATACDDAAAHLFEPVQWNERLERGVLAPYLVAQRWRQLWLKWPQRGRASLVALTQMGGDFGLSANCAAPEGGALTGLVKSLFIEELRSGTEQVRCFALDTHRDEDPESAATWLLDELAADVQDVEVGYGANRRLVLSPVAEAAPSADCTVAHGGVWVVSGGACGISAETALALGRRYGLKLHLLGRSPAPAADAPWRGKSPADLEPLKAQIVREAIASGQSPTKAWERVRRDIEIWNNLQRFQAAGVAATYHCCDVADRPRLLAVLDQIRRSDGPIQGILHGAGTNNPSRLERKPRAVVEEMLAAKVAGAWNLMALTRQDPVRYFVGFGSVTGRFGGNGMTDYAAVNDMLARLTAWYRRERPDCHAVTCSWESWGDVGMAVAPRHVMAGVHGKLEFMPPQEGVEHIVRELEAGTPDAEVVFTRERFIAERYPHVRVGRLAEIAPLALPLVERTESSAHGFTAHATLDPIVDPFLKEHRLRGKPLMPAVVGLELLAEAALASAPGFPAKPPHVVELADIEITDGLSFSTHQPARPQVIVEQQGPGSCRARLVCDFFNRSGKLIQPHRPYLHGHVRWSDVPQPIAMTCPPPPTSGWRAFQYEDAHLIYHGPCLRGVVSTTFGAAEGWARLVALPLQGLAGRRPAKGWIVPSTLLDAAFYACGIHVWFHGGQAVSLPHGIRALRLSRPMRSHEQCLVRFICRKLDDAAAEYDFTIFGEDGTPIVDVAGYRKVLLRQRGGA